MSANNKCVIGVIVLVTLTTGLISANPAKPSFWKNTPLDDVVNEMRSNCADGNDSFACIKYKVINFLDTIFKKDSYKVSDDIEIRQNGYSNENNEINGRSESGFIDTIEQYVQSHDVTFNVPIADAKVTVSPRNINNDELNVKVKFSENNVEDASSSVTEARKSKLKKIAIPIMVFILLKAMTLIPLALGVLGLKAWNALQLSFFSFVVSLALAIFQLCKKIATDNHHPQIAAHGPWDRRSIVTGTVDEPSVDENAQNMAYNAYN